MKMNINMKKIVFFLLVQFVTLGAFAQEATIKEAEVAYTKEDYGKAIELYEGLLKTHGESAEIYYNLGNAYYKENKITPAILNYERALLLDPGDGDIRFNLQLARQKSVDKIEPVGDFFLHRWFDKVQNMGAADSWAQIGIVCFNIFAGNQKDELVNRKSAIVFAPTVTVKSSPDASGTDLFILHEGTKVSIKSKLGDWNEIEMEDGNVGWMPSKDMEII